MMNEANSDWPWGDELDALVAAPEHHTLLLENDRVRVVETLIPPGEQTAVHTHRWPGALTIMSWSDFVRRDAQGVTLLDTRGRSDEPPTYQWSEPLPPHSLENVGDRPLRVIAVELKDAVE